MESFSNKTYTVFQIEAKFPKSDSRQYSERWYTRTMHPSDFGEKHAKLGQSEEKVCPIYHAYGACGECWQKTGIEGFLDPTLAMLAFHKLMRFVGGKQNVTQWRLVKRTIAVELEEIAQYNAPILCKETTCSKSSLSRSASR